MFIILNAKGAMKYAKSAKPIIIDIPYFAVLGAFSWCTLR